MFDKHIYIIMVCAAIALLYSFITSKVVLKKVSMSENVRDIFLAIKVGAESFLKRQYTAITSVAFVISLIIWKICGIHTAIGFVIGSFLSGLCGYIGMSVSIRANVRTALAASEGISKAFDCAFKGGSITGFLVVGLGLFGISSCCLMIIKCGFNQIQLLECLISFAFGSSLISIFAKLGGGIFTKGADVGADLVGKIEKNIPEDDPRNPAVIADNVGDNVGDCAGMAGDMFQTYVATIIGAIYLFFDLRYEQTQLLSPEMLLNLCFYPALICAISIPASIIGCSIIKVKQHDSIISKMYRGLFLSSFLSMAGMTLVTHIFIRFFDPLCAIGSSDFLTGIHLLQCCLIGLSCGLMIFGITHYYTDSAYRPVQSIAKSCITGPGTGIIQGVGVGLESCALPFLVIILSIVFAYTIAGIFGIAVASVAMLSISGCVISLDAYGPITDNAGGIAEMSGMPESVRKVTDTMDAVGNTTKAVTKGFSVSSSILASIVVFHAFCQNIHRLYPDISFNFSLCDPFILAGILIGGIIVFLFGSMSMLAVGKAGQAIVFEVQRQFNEIPGIMENKSKPDYSIAIDILTKKSLKEMIAPSILIFVPLLVYFIISSMFNKYFAISCIGGIMMGTTFFGFNWSVFMTSLGGAFDNAKKFIESGRFNVDGVVYKKGCEAYKAAVVGDTLGDPMKDTTGPAINPMVKAIVILCLMITMFG